MKTLLLFSSVLFLNFASAQQIQVYDYAHDTHISYENQKTRLEPKLFEHLTNVDHFQLDETQWKGAAKINQLIIGAVQQLNSDKFIADFKANFDALVAYKIKELHDECIEESKAEGYDSDECDYLLSKGNEYTLDGKHASFHIVSLCNSTLITSLTVEYSLMHKNEYYRERDLIYSNVHYYDLEKGVEIDPKSILVGSKKNALEKLVQQHIPEPLKALDLDVSEGLPLFYGTGFYYVVSGSNGVNFPKHLREVEVRIPLEEIKPFLNPKGAFAAYKDVELSQSNYQQIGYAQLHYNDSYLTRHADALRSLEKFLESLSGEAFSNMKLSVASESIQAVFNEQGHLLHYKFGDIEEGLIEDSIAFEYDETGARRGIHHFQLYDYEDEETEEEFFLMGETEAFLFDQNENLIEYREYDDQAYFENEPYEEVEIIYFSYLGDLVLLEEYSIDEEEAYGSYADMCTIKEGEVIENHHPVHENTWMYDLVHRGDTTMMIRTLDDKTVVEFAVIVENGVPTKKLEDNGRRMTEYTYDSAGRPQSIKRFNKAGDSYMLGYSAEVVYNAKGLPVSYTSDSGGKTNTFEFAYTNY